MVASKDYDMDTADSIVAPVRGLETVTVTVAKYPQCGVVGAPNSLKKLPATDSYWANISLLIDTDHCA